MQSNGLNSQPADNESMILEEEIDETYEPTKEEILEYAEYIGIDLEEDKDLLYLAKEGLKAPLPPDWKPCQNREGKIYYFNFKTKQSQWEHPCDQYYKKLYQELKKKKEKSNEKQPTFKVKNNSSNQSKQVLNKKEPLPALKSNAFQGLETSFNAENQNAFSLNNEDQESQSTENKEIKTILTDFESFKAPEKDQPPVDDFVSYEKEKQQEIEKLQKLHQETKDEIEKKLQREIDRHLKEFKKTLINKSNSNNFLREKEQIKANLAKEYKAQFEEKLSILKDIHRENKAQFEIKESDKIKQDLRLEEEDLNEEYEMKIISLKQEKKGLENKLQENQKRQNEARLKIEQEFENEKSALTRDYSRLIREARAKEDLAQKTEIQNYKNLMRDKLENEKRILIDVKKQKESIRNARVAELTKIYERQLKLEEEKLENNLIKNLKEFEEHEKIKRDKDILKIYNDETNHAKTTQELFVQNEIENLRNDLKSRLEHFQQLLKEKFKKEKQDLDHQIEERISQYKVQVQDIKIDLINTREEILIQLRKGCAKEDHPISQIEEINSRIQAQKEENNKLRETLHSLQSEQRAVQSNFTKIVQDLTQKIKKADLEISTYNNGSKPQKSVRPKSASLNRREHSKSAINLDALKKDVEEIKALVTNRDRNRPTLVSGRETVRETRGSHRHSLMIGKLPLWINPIHPQGDLPLTQKTRNWNHILNVEQDKLRTLKKDYKGSRAALKKAHECLSYDREKFNLQYTHKHSSSINQPFYKNELKTNLNSNIEKLNQGVSHLKQTGELIKNKEKILNQLKTAVSQFENYEISLGELEALYQEYQSIQIVEQTAQKENLATTARHHKPKSVLYDDFDFEQSICNTSRAIEESQILKPHLVPKQYSQRNTAQEADIHDQGNYSYRNLISILEMKVKSDTLIPTSLPVQRQITRSTNSRAKLQNMFRDHSRFLTDIKDQLNKTLYERPSKSTSFIK